MNMKELEAFNWLEQAPTQVETLLKQDFISYAEVCECIADYEAADDKERAASQVETIETAKSILKLAKMLESLRYKYE